MNSARALTNQEHLYLNDAEQSTSNQPVRVLIICRNGSKAGGRLLRRTTPIYYPCVQPSTFSPKSQTRTRTARSFSSPSVRKWRAPSFAFFFKREAVSAAPLFYTWFLSKWYFYGFPVTLSDRSERISMLAICRTIKQHFTHI